MGFLEKQGRFREMLEGSTRSALPRICMPTWRNFTKKVFQCSLYEAQDVLVEIDDVDLIGLDMTLAAWFKESWLRFPLYHTVSSKLMFCESRVQEVKEDTSQ